MSTFPFRAERWRRKARRPLGLAAVGPLWPSGDDDGDDDGDDGDEDENLKKMTRRVKNELIQAGATSFGQCKMSIQKACATLFIILGIFCRLSDIIFSWIWMK